MRTVRVLSIQALALVSLLFPPGAEAAAPVRSKVVTCAYAEMGASSELDQDSIEQGTNLDPLVVQSYASVQDGGCLVSANTAIGATWEDASSGSLHLESRLLLDNWECVSGAVRSCTPSSLTYVVETEGDAELAVACSGVLYSVSLLTGDTTYYSPPVYQLELDDGYPLPWISCSGAHEWSIQGAGEHTIRIGLLSASYPIAGVGRVLEVRSLNLSWELRSVETGVPAARLNEPPEPAAT